jgi:hypothetical protein
MGGDGLDRQVLVAVVFGQEVETIGQVLVRAVRNAVA